VSRRNPDPSTFITQISLLLSLRFEANAMRVPSGENTGCMLDSLRPFVGFSRIPWKIRET